MSSSLGFGMKRTSVLYSACLGAFVSIGCSQGGLPTGPSAQGGSAPAQGGSVSSGGTGPVAGGTGPVAGGTGPATGGTGDGMMSAGGSGGTGPVTSMGGSAPATGGQSASGGSGPAAGGSGPAAGGSGSAAVDAVIPGLNGYYWEGTCAGSIAVEGHNCPMSDSSPTCPTNGINREKTLAVKGVSGQLYTVNIEVRGVIGTRCYTGGTRASTATLSEAGTNNWWYSGGTYANPTGWWNSYELHVSPSTGDASGDVYYFNGSGVQGGNDCEREATYLVKYNASFKVKGGGTLTFKIHDQNCKGQQNCGSNPDGNTVCAPRNVDLSGMAASPPANFTQPPANGTYKPQWMLIAVTSITPSP